MEDSQFSAGFGGQLGYMASPGEVIAERVTEKIKRLNHLHWLTNVRWVIFDRQGENVSYTRIEKKMLNLSYQHLIISRSVESGWGTV